jgi:hypothetical protein
MVHIVNRKIKKYFDRDNAVAARDWQVINADCLSGRIYVFSRP